MLGGAPSCSLPGHAQQDGLLSGFPISLAARTQCSRLATPRSLAPSSSHSLTIFQRRWLKNQNSRTCHPTRKNTCSQPPPQNLMEWDRQHQDLLGVPATTRPRTGDAQQARIELHLRSQAWRALARMAGGFMPDLRLRQLAQKVLALTRPSASDIASKDHQPGTAVGA